MPAPPSPNDDPHLWLEEVENPDALAWVETRSAATRERLASDPRFAEIYAHAERVHDDPRAIPFPDVVGDDVYNFWKDADHPRGIWRRASRERYLAGDPDWEVLIDVDALGRDEGVNWTWAGSTILRDGTGRHALVALSRGGGDAAIQREFDLETKTFVEGGFTLPESKGNAVWADADTLLVAVIREDDDATASGYPRRLRRWRRGTSFDEAPVLLEAGPDDVALFAGAIRTPSRHHLLAHLAVGVFESELFVLEGDTFTKLDLPLDADVRFYRDRLLIKLRSDWTAGGTTHVAGSLLATGYDDFVDGRYEVETLEHPPASGTIESVQVSRDVVIVNRLENVQSQLVVHRYDGDTWTRRTVDAPAGGSLDIVFADAAERDWFFSAMTFLEPLALHHAKLGAVGGEGAGAGGGPGADTDTPIPSAELYRLPSYFDASRYETHLRHATSRDGTDVPYFVVHARGLALDGDHPTHLYGYGGFEVTQRPTYLANAAEAWLARGGVYAMACIRGGGERGPSWHRAARRENRQRAFDDFIAVAEDLVASGFTRPERLGITGGSNGGLLVGAAMTQRPDLFGAVVAAVPLFDMRRYHRLLAGASWMSEFGDPDDPGDWVFIGAYSPYQNVREGVSYPPLLLITSTRDDRVHPGHARKMAAKLEALGQPVHYYENTEGGHAAAATGKQFALKSTLTHVFLLQALSA